MSLHLPQVPGLVDGWHELRDKFVFEKDAFKATVLEKHHTKKAEYQAWLDAVRQVHTHMLASHT